MGGVSVVVYYIPKHTFFDLSFLELVSEPGRWIGQTAKSIETTHPHDHADACYALRNETPNSLLTPVALAR